MPMVWRHFHDRLRAFPVRLRSSDPGLLRLKRACRVVVATVSGVAAVWSLQRFHPILASSSALAMAFLTAMFLTMRMGGESRRRQQVTLLAGGALAASMPPLFAALDASAAFSQAAQVALVFGAFYLRRFGVRYGIAGFLAVMMYIFSGVMLDRVPRWPPLSAAAIVSSLAAFMVHSYLLPDNRRDALRDRLADAIRSGAALLGLIDEVLAGALPLEEAADRARQIAADIRKDLVISRELLGPLDESASPSQSAERRAWVWAYRLAGALFVVADGAKELEKAADDWPPGLREDLTHVFRDFQRLLRSGLQEREWDEAAARTLQETTDRRIARWTSGSTSFRGHEVRAVLLLVILKQALEMPGPFFRSMAAIRNGGGAP